MGTLTLVRLATVVVWLGAEAVLQARQWRWGGATRSREWTSLVVLLVAATVGGTAAAPVARLVGTVGGEALAVGGLVVAWAGIVLRLSAIRTLGRYFRGVVTVHADHEVVRAGPYAVLRHPSYTGALVAVLGLACSVDLVAGLVTTAFLALGLAYRIRVEERTLVDALGDPYRAYAATTWRLVPGVW